MSKMAVPVLYCYTFIKSIGMFHNVVKKKTPSRNDCLNDI